MPPSRSSCKGGAQMARSPSSSCCWRRDHLQSMRSWVQRWPCAPSPARCTAGFRRSRSWTPPAPVVRPSPSTPVRAPHSWQRPVACTPPSTATAAERVAAVPRCCRPSDSTSRARASRKRPCCSRSVSASASQSSITRRRDMPSPHAARCPFQRSSTSSGRSRIPPVRCAR